MDEQAFFTLGEAAKQVGRSKATISNAVKSGRLSVHEKTESGFRIAASELFRAFPPDERSNEQTRTPQAEGVNTAALVELEGLRRENVLLKDERNDLRRRLDMEGDERRKLTAILTDQRAKTAHPAPLTPSPAPTTEKPPKGLRGWLHRLTG